MKKLDTRGIGHEALIMLFVVIFAISGVGYLVATRASSVTPNPSNCQNINLTAVPPANNKLAPLYDYFNPKAHDHYYNLARDDVSLAKLGWCYQAPTGGANVGTGGGGEGYAYINNVLGTVPLHQWTSYSLNKHFYTTLPSNVEPNGCCGYIAQGDTAYISPTKVAGTTELYRFYDTTTGAHFYTTDARDVPANGPLAPYGYHYEFVQGYVWTSPTAAAKTPAPTPKPKPNPAPKPTTVTPQPVTSHNPVTPTPSPKGAVTLTGLHKIKHVVVIMQENHSFDNYFGTFPGADGIPMRNGVPTVCVPDPNKGKNDHDPNKGKCVKPYHDTNLTSSGGGGPHGADAAAGDINGGQMNGFIAQVKNAANYCPDNSPNCNASANINVMGYRTASEIPNYWSYAQNYVLQDHLFEPNSSWSSPEHLFLVSEWSAKCSRTGDPYSCVNALESPDRPLDFMGVRPPNYAWTDMTWLLHKNNVSWGYYVFNGQQPDCEDDAEATCPGVKQDYKTPGIWNPLPSFTTVKQDGQLGNIQPLKNFYGQAKNGNLPAVSWVIPSQEVSEHPYNQNYKGGITKGQAYVTGLINTIMQGPDWDSTAIFVSWDDWGGFYDHVQPPHVDENGYGLRVPGLVVSAYAKQGYIDHQTLSHDAYNKFIEDVFLNGQRLNPSTDGRPDPRPNVRENDPQLGNLAKDFNFNQTPRQPSILPGGVTYTK